MSILIQCSKTTSHTDIAVFIGCRLQSDYLRNSSDWKYPLGISIPPLSHSSNFTDLLLFFLSPCPHQMYILNWDGGVQTSESFICL